MDDIVTYTMRAVQQRLQAQGMPAPQCRALTAEVDAEVRMLYGNERVYVPQRGRARSLRDRAICEEYASGHSVATLMHRYQLKERQIYNVLSSMPEISKRR